MNTREIAEEYRLSHWAAKMQERQQFGLSIKAYCEQQGFHENVYYYWQRKLREAACAELVAKEQATDLVPAGWARLTTDESVSLEQALTIEINGCCVAVTAETDSELLAKVCRALKAL
jgi:hypothetical protein